MQPDATNIEIPAELMAEYEAITALAGALRPQVEELVRRSQAASATLAPIRRRHAEPALAGERTPETIAAYDDASNGVNEAAGAFRADVAILGLIDLLNDAL